MNYIEQISLIKSEQIQGSGIYYKTSEAASFKKSDFVHEHFELAISNGGLRNKELNKATHHASYEVIENHARFALLMGEEELSDVLMELKYELLKLILGSPQPKAVLEYIEQLNKLLERIRTDEFKEEVYALWNKAKAIPIPKIDEISRQVSSPIEEKDIKAALYFLTSIINAKIGTDTIYSSVSSSLGEGENSRCPYFSYFSPVKIKPLKDKYREAKNLLTNGNFLNSKKIFEGMLDELKRAEKYGKLGLTAITLKCKVENGLRRIEENKERDGLKRQVRNERLKKELNRKGKNPKKERSDVRNAHKHLNVDVSGSGSSPVISRGIPQRCLLTNYNYYEGYSNNLSITSSSASSYIKRLEDFRVPTPADLKLNSRGPLEESESLPFSHIAGSSLLGESLNRLYLDFFDRNKMFGIAGNQDRFVFAGSRGNQRIYNSAVVFPFEFGGYSDNRGSYIKNSENLYERKDVFFLSFGQGRINEKLVFGEDGNACLGPLDFDFFKKGCYSFVTAQMVNDDVGVNEIVHQLRNPFAARFPISTGFILIVDSFGRISRDYAAGFSYNADCPSGRWSSGGKRHNCQPFKVLNFIFQYFQLFQYLTIHSLPPFTISKKTYTIILYKKQLFDFAGCRAPGQADSPREEDRKIEASPFPPFPLISLALKGVPLNIEVSFKSYKNKELVLLFRELEMYLERRAKNRRGQGLGSSPLGEMTLRLFLPSGLLSAL